MPFNAIQLIISYVLQLNYDNKYKIMGNQETRSYTPSNVRRRTFQPLNDSQYMRQSQRIFKKSQVNTNLSLDISRNRRYESATIDNKEYQNLNRKSNTKFNTIQYQNQESVNENYPTSRLQRKENDRILEKLSEKNQELRRQLKKISDLLTEKLKRKKLIPKKKLKINEEQQQAKQVGSTNVALKRQLQNGYRQIDMYKKTLDSLKGRQCNQQASSIKIKRLQNDIVDMDLNINTSIKKVEGLKKIKKGQQQAIEKDLNEQLHNSIEIYKQELEIMKKKLKQIAEKDRQKQPYYKKQQAYLCQIQKKLRIVNGQYFTQRKQQPQKSIKIARKRTTASSKNSDNLVQPDYDEFQAVLQQYEQLKLKHEEYYKKIDLSIKHNKKLVEEHYQLKKLLEEKYHLYKNLNLKSGELKKILKPSPKKIFGGYQHEVQTEIITDQQPQEEIKQQEGQFDIKHLLANIPKPVRKKPQLIQIQSPLKKPNRQKSFLSATLQKAQPKKWDTVLTRTQQKGKTFKGELKFNDGQQFDSSAQPKIVGMNIWINQNQQILGLQAIYLKKQDIRYGYKSSTACQGTILHYDLQRPDYIKNITGYFGVEGFIDHLVIISKLGKTGRFGKQRDDQVSFNYGLSSGQRPFFIYGASTLYQSCPRINKLGLQICSDQ